MILTSRSQKTTRANCPRHGFWGYYYRQKEDSLPGLSGRGVSIPLLTGGMVHEGLALLLRGRSLNQAIVVAQEGFQEALVNAELIVAPGEEAKKSVASAYPPEILEWTIRQEQALIEAFLRAFEKVILPGLKLNWEILEVEREGIPLNLGMVATSLISEGHQVLYQWRPDGILLSTGPEPELVILSFKTSGWVGKPLLLALSRSDQAISEMYCLEQVMKFWHSHLEAGESLIPKWYLSHFSQLPHPPKVNGTQLIILNKGMRKEDKSTPGKFVQYSPLIRGYRQEGVQGLGMDQYAWSWDTPKVSKQGNPYMGTLGTSWKSFPVWEGYPTGVEGWIDLLASGTIQTECGDPLSSQFIVPELVVRNEWIVESWARQLIAGELEAAQKSFEANEALREGSWEKAIVTLDKLFPQNRESCVKYRSLCQMDHICSGPPQVLLDPLATGLYRERRPHHELEGEEE